ncbi:hypothetical protein L7F22_044519 [Adiantum nelumboides]|nr:hypothetical protein [Adiantum nelumboides]
MQQHSIFEPLFSFQSAAPSNKMELMSIMQRRAPDPAFIPQQYAYAPPHSWFTETPPPSTTCIGTRRASCSSLPIMHNHTSTPIVSSNFAIHTAQLSSSSTSRNEQLELASLDRFPKACDDDGSIASKLLSSITKSISSPSLHLACSKEASRETPYQKSLKLKHLKLQHCAEALGMESSDSLSLSVAGYDTKPQSMQLHEKLDMIENLAICPSTGTSTPPLKISNQEYSPLTSVKSAPSLSAPPMMMTSQTSKSMRGASFPPPLSHTLPASPSCDSLSLSLRPYRQAGRLVLKEVMVPSRNYFYANRKDGRLTLRVLTRDLVEGEDEYPASQYHQQGLISSQSCELDNAIVEEEDMTLKESIISSDKPAQLEVENCDTEIVYTKRVHPLVEDASVKASVHNIELLMGDVTNLLIAAKVLTVKSVCSAPHDNRDRYANPCIATTSNLLNLKRMQCSHVMPQSPHRHAGPATRHVKSNIISSVIALTLQTVNYSKLTLRKAQALNCLQSSSSHPLSSGSINQVTAIHSPGRSHLLTLSHHDMSTFSESKENFIWESNLKQCMAVSRPKSIRRSENASSFALEGLHENSMMKMMTGFATVGVSCDVRDWCTDLAANRGKPYYREANNNKLITDAWPNDLDFSTIVEAYNALSSIIVMGGGRSSGQTEYGANHGNGFNAHLGLKHQFDEEKASIGQLEAGNEVSSSSSLYSTNSASAASPPTYLQSTDEWLHTLHCKELSDRNQFGICSFIQPHSCIATRS